MNFTTPVYPGVDLEDSQGPEMNAVAVAFIVLSLVTLVLRFLSRRLTQVSLGTDDWLIVVAAVRSNKSSPVSSTGR